MAQALIFDSGVGGLSVASEIRSLRPDIRMSYVADDAFRPYGDKSERQLQDRLPGLLQTLEFMTKPDVIVIACNTASTTALPQIRAAAHAPVVGVVPAIKPAAQASQTKTIAVLGTPGTVKRKYVDRLIQDYAADCDVILQGSVGLVELAERKMAGADINPADIKSEIAPLFSQSGTIDHVVLACTHFPLLKDELEKAAPYPVDWIDSGAAIARRVDNILSELKAFGEPVFEFDTAFSTGKDKSAARAATFQNYGFEILLNIGS